VTKKALVFLVLALLSTSRAALQRYDVIWKAPSKDYSGSMPLGNGDIALNIWVEENGDLLFYIGKSDSWGDNGRLLKVGKLRITFDPPLCVREGFEQRLDLESGTVFIKAGRERRLCLVEVWVDANHPAVNVVWKSDTPVGAKAKIELWRRRPYELPSLEVSDVLLDRSKPDRRHAPMIVEPDTLVEELKDAVGWFHYNKKSVGPSLTAKIQGLADFPRPDPLLHRIFGALITGKDAEKIDNRTLAVPPSRNGRFSVYVLTLHPSSPRQWLSRITELSREIEKIPLRQRREAHRKWWKSFWNRSWIYVSGGGRTARLVPQNNRWIIAGQDQTGQNAFRGGLGRISIFLRALSPQEIEKLARDSRKKLPPQQTLLGSWTDVKPGRKLLKPKTLQAPITIEAWVKPGAMPPGGGRIVDRITPGGADGFLLDTYPGNSLRLIVGNRILQKAKVLPADKWSHVAAVIDPAGLLALYLNGKEIVRSKVDLSPDSYVVTRGYVLQRFINACCGRGRYPIKFNGSLLTVPFPGRPGDADYRRWGPGYWWQNTRLPYYTMCTAGDFDLMMPLFRMYAQELMPLFVYRTKRYFGHGGAFIPECIYFWGDVFSETYGWTPFEKRKDKLQESRWHKWEWVSGLELVWLMLDYYEHTVDRSFLFETLFPAAWEILTFFDKHYKRDEKGKLVMHPAQALETWWECTNPAPETAGLRAVTKRLLSLPQDLLPAEKRQFLRNLLSTVPELPTRKVPDGSALAPAWKYARKSNIENPELYPVFPFRLVSFEKSNATLGLKALEHRWDRGNFGWRQDEVFMAYLGLAEQAKAYLVGRARRHHKGSRFPAFWGPNYDWIPDQDHGSILMKALQSMLIQTEGRKIFLFPAWPRSWNVSFKVWAPYRTTLEGELKEGRLLRLQVTPRIRRNDVVLPPYIKSGVLNEKH